MFGFNKIKKQEGSSAKLRDRDMKSKKFSGFAAFMFLPQLSKMLRPFQFIGLSLARLVAIVFANSGLLSAETLQKAYQGKKLSVFKIFSEARRNISWSLKGAPQIGLYVSVLGVMLFSVISLATIGLDVAIGSAAAQEYFKSGSESDDIGLSLIHMLFGIAGNNVNAIGSLAIYQQAVQSMLEFYSLAMLVFACFIILYNLIAIVMETAHHGQPFGKRHSAIYTPIRTVFAIAMLLPITAFNGLNLGQVSVLKLAEAGSNLASNAWGVFLDSMNDSVTNLARPSTPLIVDVVENQFLMAFCTDAYNYLAGETVKATDQNSYNTINSNRENFATGLESAWEIIDDADGVSRAIQPYLIYNSKKADDEDGWIRDIQAFFGYPRNVTFSAVDYRERSICGEIKLLYPEKMDEDVRQRIYYAHITAMNNIYQHLGANERMQGLVEHLLSGGQKPFEHYNFDALLDLVVSYDESLATAAEATRDDAKAELAVYLSDSAKVEGWIAAPKFYNHISRINAQILEYASQPPIIKQPQISKVRSSPMICDHYGSPYGYGMGGMPTNCRRVDKPYKSIDDKVIEAVAAAKAYYREEFSKIRSNAQINPGGADADTVQRLGTPDDDAPQKLGDSDIDDGDTSMSYLRQFSAWVLGTDPEKLEGQNFFKFDPEAPLASMAAFGHAQINRAFVFLGVSAVFSMAVTGGGSPIDMVLGLMATVGLAAGVVLAYMVPLLPFIRFITGILAWLMALLEAVVAIPIMALGHLNTEGEGLPGPMARQGYMLMLQLFLRPVMMIFGLVLSIVLFTVGIFALNELWSTVTVDAYGETSMNVFSQLVYSVIYAVIAYTMANMCFKLIDILPNESLRWIGSGGLAGPSDEGGDVGRVLIAGAAIGNELAQAADRVGTKRDGSKMGLAGRKDRMRSQHAQMQREKEFDEMLEKRGLLGGNNGGGGSSGPKGGSIT